MFVSWGYEHFCLPSYLFQFRQSHFSCKLHVGRQALSNVCYELCIETTLNKYMDILESSAVSRILWNSLILLPTLNSAAMQNWCKLLISFQVQLASVMQWPSKESNCISTQRAIAFTIYSATLVDSASARVSEEITSQISSWFVLCTVNHLYHLVSCCAPVRMASFEYEQFHLNSCHL